MSNKNNNELKEANEKINQLANQLVQFRDIAQSNEIILNRTLRFVTGRLLKIKTAENVTKEIDDLIADLNVIETKEEKQ